MEKASLSSQTKPKKEITTLAKGASLSLLGKIGGRGFHTIGQILLARMLGPELFGLYALGWTILNIGALLAPLGLHNGVIHFGTPIWQSGNHNRNHVITKSLRFSITAGTIFGIVLFIIAPILANQVFKKPDLLPVLRGFSLALPFISGLRVATAATRIPERMEYTVYAEDLLQPAANLLLLGLLFVLGGTLLPSVLVGTISFGIALLLGLYYIRQVFPSTTNKHITPEISSKEILKYSIATTFGSLFTMLIMWIDRLLVGYFLSAENVGIYQVASQTAMLFGIVLTAFNTIFTPMIARLYYSGDKSRLQEMFIISTKWGLYLSIPFFIVIFFLSEKVMSTIYGQEYGGGWFALLILSFAQLINAGTGAVGFMLNMTGNQNRWVMTAGCMLILDVLLNLILIPRIGISGSAIATGISVIGLFTIGLFQVKKIIGFWPYDRRYLKGGVATIIAGGAVFFIKFFQLPDAIYLIFAVTLASCIFFGVLWFAGFDGEDKEVFQTIQKRIFP